MRLAEEAKKQHLDELVDGRLADYHKLPFADNSLDGGYQIEAFCHATDLKKVYSEVCHRDRAVSPRCFLTHV